MPRQVKKVLQWIFWIFVIYAIFMSPNRAADILLALWDIIVTGFTSVGMDVLLLGPVPTPGVAMMTRSMRAA